MHKLKTSRRPASASPRHPHRVLGALALVSLGGTWAGCASEDGDEPNAVETPSVTIPAAQEMTASEELSEKSESLTVGETLCTFANSLPNIKAPGGTVTFSGGCRPKDPTFQTFYNGSSSNDLTAFTSQPFLMNSAYFCALAESHNTRASALRDTAVGRFGIDSKIVITERNPTTGRVRGQRIGTVHLFGAAARLEVQNFEWRNFQEQRPAGTVLAWPGPQTVGNAIGYHSRLNHSATDWEFAGSGSWPIAGPISFEVFGGLQQRADYASRNNNNVSDPAVANIPEFSLASRQQRCAAGDSEACLRDSEVFGALRLCGTAPGRACTPDDSSTGTDKIIPYDGSAGGAAGPFVFRDSVPNWFHYGKPGAGVSKVLPGEPVFDLPVGGSIDANKNQSTTHFNVGFGMKFALGPVKVGVRMQPSIGLRDGLSLRQERDFGASGEFPNTPTVTAALDAEASLKLDVPVTVEIPLFPDWSHTFNILNSERAPAATNASRMQYFPREGFKRYEVGGVAASNPTAALQTCMAAPTTRAGESPDDAGSFMSQVRTNAVKEVHPCKVKICKGTSGDRYDWDSSTSSLKFVGTEACANSCGTTISLCNARNEVIIGDDGKPATAVRPKDLTECNPR